MNKSETGNKMWPVMRRLLSFIKPHRLWLLVCVVVCFANAAIDISIAFVLKNITNFALNGQRDELIHTLFMMLAILSSGVAVSFIIKYSSGRFCFLSIRDIRSRTADHIAKLPVSYMEAHHSGDTVSRLTNDVTAVQNFLENDFYNLIYLPIVFIGAFTYMLFLNWKLLLFTMVLMPAAGILTGVLSKPIGKLTGQLQDTLGKVNSVAQDTIGGIQMLKAFNLKNNLFSRYKENVDNALEKSLSIELRTAFITPVKVILNIAPLVLSILFGGYLTIRGQLTAGGLIAFINLLGNGVVRPVSSMPDLVKKLREALGAAGHLFEVLEQPLERSGGSSYTAADVAEFDNVTFSYDGQKNILDGVSFKLQPKKMTALVGPSGSGKTTVFKLLCGFCEPQGGSVKLNGEDLKNWKLEAARSQVSLVSQDTYLFPASIAENIAYGNPDASMDDIIAAAKTANAHEFIMEMPEGYNTPAGERGARLSGGQKQRISIARAVLKNAPILLLDEPTSALDIQSEMLVQEALENFIKEHTVIVIAHRLSTIKEAHEVMVLDQGCIAESGTHDQLMEKDGLYRQLYLKQFISQDCRQEALDGKGA